MSLNLNLSEVSLDNQGRKSTQNAASTKPKFQLFKHSTTSKPASLKPSGIPKTRRSKKKIFFSILLIIILVLGIVTGLLYYRADQFLRATGLNFTPLETLLFILGRKDAGSTGTTGGDGQTTKNDPVLLRDATGKYTNILLVGIDTRADGEVYNTDTMITVTYNYDLNRVLMYSVPRDLMVKIPTTGNYGKINSVYATSERAKKGSGLPALQKVLADVTGISTQYYAMVDLQGFVKIVDILGGVTVNVENSFIDCKYPWEGAAKNTSLMGTKCYSKAAYAKGGSQAAYEPIQFIAGSQEMDGTRALKYARSRHSLDNGEGSDFARAARQQRLIEAIKKKLLSTDTFTNPQKILDLLSAVQDNVKFSGYTIDDVQAGLNLLNTAKSAQIISFVLDPSIGSYGILTENNVIAYGYAIKPIKGFGNYTDVHAYVAASLIAPEMYIYDPNIRVYDTGLGYQASYKKTLALIAKYPFINFLFMGTISTKTTGNVVFKVDASTKQPYMQYLMKFVDTTVTTKPAGLSANVRGADVGILLGKPAPKPVDTTSTTGTSGTAQ